MHYLYIAAPVAFSPHDCDAFKTYLDAQVGQFQPAIQMVQMVMRENLYGFQGNQQNPYLKITVTDPKHISRVRAKIESGEANWKGMWKGADVLTFDMIQYVLRFMVDCKVRTYFPILGQWLTNLDLRYVLGRSSSQIIQTHSPKLAAFQLSNRGGDLIPRFDCARA